MKFFHAKWLVFQKTALQICWNLIHITWFVMCATQKKEHFIYGLSICQYRLQRRMYTRNDTVRPLSSKHTLNLTEQPKTRTEELGTQYWLSQEYLKLAWVQTKAHLDQHHGDMMIGNHGPDKQGRTSKAIKQFLLNAKRSPSLLWESVNTSC